ncbi:MAG: hypothetical protein KIT62_01465 [Cyclobacteriaceae bacterium]|nr:hypothetical protein [Cyclobacteriaceae bacterium]
MKRLIFTYGLTLISILCIGQGTFTIKGQLKYCYDKPWSDNFKDFPVEIDDIEPHYGVGHEVIYASESGEFIFINLKASNYKISASLVNRSEVVIKVDRNVTDVILCLDDDFRPVPQDTLTASINKAKLDIDHNNLRIYHLLPWLAIHKRSFYRRNKRLKRKFNFEIETVGCLLISDRKSFIEQEKYLTYNKVAEEYLDKKYGASWRRALR